MTSALLRAYILWVCALTFFANLSLAQSGFDDLSTTARAERQALIAGGYPLFDTAGQLTQSERIAILSLLDELEVCCNLTIALVLQDMPQNSSAQQDIEILLRQLQRTQLWTEQSLVILLQAQPMDSLAIRSESLSNRTQSLGARELQALGVAAAEGAAAQALIQALQALSTNLDRENLSFGGWSLGRSAQGALYHTCLFLAVGCLVFVVFWRLQKEPTLPRPTRLRVIRAKATSLHGIEFDPLNSGIDVLFIRQARAPRHWFALLILVFLLGVIGVLVLEPAFWGATSLWEQWQLWIFTESWIARIALNLGLGLGIFILLALSPLGSWISPRSLSHARQSRLLAQRLQLCPELNRITLILVWRRVSQKLEVWEPAHAVLANPRMDTILNQLEADFRHGEAMVGLQRFINHYDQLMHVRSRSEAAGKVAEIRA